MSENTELGAVLERLAEIEAGLDPQARRRPQFIADLGGMALMALIGVSIDWHFNRPLLLLAAILLAGGANRVLWHVLRYPLRQERERLLSSLGENALGVETGQVDNPR